MLAKPPPPLEWHPAYRDKTWLLDWLEGRYLNYDVIRLPVPHPSRWAFADADQVDVLRVLAMTRRKAYGPAPYVGRPFAYVWWFGEDDLGRCIAGEARIVYIEDETGGRGRA